MTDAAVYGAGVAAMTAVSAWVLAAAQRQRRDLGRHLDHAELVDELRAERTYLRLEVDRRAKAAEHPEHPEPVVAHWQHPDPEVIDVTEFGDLPPTFVPGPDWPTSPTPSVEWPWS